MITHVSTVRKVGQTPFNLQRIGRTAMLAAVLALASALATPLACAATCRVTAAGSTSGDGTGWDFQAMTLQTAIGEPGCTEIWVAAGIYVPGPQVTDSFSLMHGVDLYGGFNGTETSLGERNPLVNITILSGDIGGDDINVDGNWINEVASDIQGSNSQHVLYLDTPYADVVKVNGFIITGGSASASGGGGGVYCDGSGPGQYCYAYFRHVTFSGNAAGQNGGAVYNDGTYYGYSSPNFSDVRFIGNHAGSNGGAIYNDGAHTGTSSPTLMDVTFNGNSAGTSASTGDGGAIFNNGGQDGDASPTLDNVTFSNNSVGSRGGAIYSECPSGTCSPVLTNVTFDGNTAGFLGDGLYNNGDYGGTCSPVLKNVILTAPIPIANGFGATPLISFSIVPGSNGSGPGWDTSLGTDGSGNIDADAMLNPLADNGGFSYTFLPKWGSPAIDLGTCTGTKAKDQRGVDRPQSGVCDIGAVEVRAQHVGGRCYVDASASGSDDGGTWTNAFVEVKTALDDSTCTEVWVAAGLYTAGPMNLAPGVAVYGGFAGTETQRSQRDASVNVSILSGDVDGNDINMDGNQIAETPADIQGSNRGPVVKLDGTTALGNISSTTVLDGLTITGGDGTGISNGGLYCDGRGAGHACSPTLLHVRFIGNRADHGGGGMYNDGRNGGNASPELTDVAFISNRAGADAFSGDGGAMLNNGEIDGNASPILTNVTFSGNSAGNFGGAMRNSGAAGVGTTGNSSPVLTNVTFSGNSAGSRGGAVFTDCYDGTCSPTYTNVTFDGNIAELIGDGLFVDGASASCNPLLTNVIMTAASPIRNLNGNISISHSIILGSGGSGSGWDTTLGNDAGGNLDADPLLNALADNGGFTATMLPMAASPAIDAGDCAGGQPATDQRGVARPLGPACDIGAVEVIPANDLIFADGFEA